MGQGQLPENAKANVVRHTKGMIIMKNINNSVIQKGKTDVSEIITREDSYIWRYQSSSELENIYTTYQ